MRQFIKQSRVLDCAQECSTCTLYMLSVLPVMSHAGLNVTHDASKRHHDDLRPAFPAYLLSSQRYRDPVLCNGSICRNQRGWAPTGCAYPTAKHEGAPAASSLPRLRCDARILRARTCP